MLDTAVSWDGYMVTSPYVDTAALRTRVPYWNDRLRFRVIAAGDTLLLPGKVEIRCIWPPGMASAFAANGNFANNSSLVFLVKTGETSVLITSDIDSSVTGQLCLQESIRLKADIMVIPHHGSGSSLDPVFYGYVKPAISIISYGADNTYGHPSPSVRLWLSQMGISVRETAIDGSCFFESNGYYWKEMKE
jgi:competence protein ComEC